ncbi:MAG: putative toxin-antitoxin system toxin component, PIN family [Anaerolineae bacterium CG2_30_64_16]|nr:MAG: putative toxin-antitoxin system toxin component, PIN family [Anaerolineae bacterium CG2_30_64_16]
MRVVVDTNILISGAIVTAGASARIVDAALGHWLCLITSASLLAEYADVIQRPHIAHKYTKIAQRVDDLLDYLRCRAVVVAGIPQERYVLADADDDTIVAAALEGHAAYIVSGDQHLLELKQVQDVRILTPRDFVFQVLKEPLA